MFVDTLKHILILLMTCTGNHGGNTSHLEWNEHEYMATS